MVTCHDKSALRVGNEEYVEANGSYGLTTLREHHVEVSGASIQIRFRGKSGKSRHVQLDDSVLARVAASLQDLLDQEQELAAIAAT